MTTIGQMTLFGCADETAVRINVAPTREVWHRKATSLRSIFPIADARDRKLIAQKNDCRWREREVPDLAYAGEIKTLLTFAQAARMLGMTRRGFRRLADRGVVAVVHVSDWSPRVRPRELQRFAGEAQWTLGWIRDDQAVGRPQERIRHAPDCITGPDAAQVVS